MLPASVERVYVVVLFALLNGKCMERVDGVKVW